MNDLLKREKVLRTIQKMFECCTTYDIINYRDLMIEAIKVLPPERQVNIIKPQEEWDKGFYEFLWNVILPNDMQKYIEMYEAQPVAVDGAKMKGADDEY